MVIMIGNTQSKRWIAEPQSVAYLAEYMSKWSRSVQGGEGANVLAGILQISPAPSWSATLIPFPHWICYPAFCPCPICCPALYPVCALLSALCFLPPLLLCFLYAAVLSVPFPICPVALVIHVPQVGTP